MSPISLFIASSLDGFITGPNESLEWLFTDQDYEYRAFFDATDAAIMGRKTFDLACTFEKLPYAGKAKYVFTRQPRTTDVPGVQFISEDPAEFSRQLGAKRGKKIWLVPIWLMSRAVDSSHTPWRRHPFVQRRSATPPLDTGAVREVFYGSRATHLHSSPMMRHTGN